MKARECPRALAVAGVVALGLLAIVGSSSVEGCFPAPGPCPGDFPDEPTMPTVEPTGVTAQVGGPATFGVHAPDLLVTAVQWYRSTGNGPLKPIAGATQPTYTLPGVQLPDDGALFAADVQGIFEGRTVELFSASARLTVSSMPGVVFQDSEFVPADWSVSALSAPAENGPSHVEEQVAAGGDPGAYRKITITLPGGQSLITLFHEYQAAIYDPAVSGPIYTIDFTQSCLKLPGALVANPQLLLEQGGRRYAASAFTPCGDGSWSRQSLNSGSLGATDFYRLDGPACEPGQSCPDFSADGLPLRFGFVSSNQGSPEFAGASGGFGLDNWKVTVWRH